MDMLYSEGKGWWTEMDDKIRQGSSREALNSIHKVLREDEVLLRLLHYSPMKKPMSIEHNTFISNIENQWNIIDKSLLIGETKVEIEEERICRIFLRLGRRRSVFGNYLLADQELVINVYVPNEYERRDMRLEWINDRISELLTHEYISGMGMMIYAKGDSRVAPHDYARYENIYQFRVGKK